MHEHFIQAMVYRRLQKGHRTYGFRFLERRTQAWWKKGLELCFEADSLFSRCNHHHYRGHNRETQAATVWHREMATRFCTDAFWQELIDMAPDDTARFLVETLHRKHLPHLYFLHHTLESLLYVAHTILPPLKKALRQAQKMLNRWSWLPWVPNTFVRHYDAYLTCTQEKLEDIEQQLIQAIRARVELVLQSSDGKTGDVIMALVTKLRQAVPRFIPEEWVKASETPLSFQELLQGKKQQVLPTTTRQVTREELSKAMHYLYQCDETRAFVLGYVEEASHVVDDILSVAMQDDEGRLLLFPHAWQSNGNVSRRTIDKAYPWCRDWTLQEGSTLLQLNHHMKKLMSENEVSMVLSPEVVTAQLNRIKSMMDDYSFLARYQKKVADYRPRSFWFRFFAKWEKTAQYQAWVLQQQQLTSLLKHIEHQQAEWIIRHAPCLLKNASVYSPKVWVQIIDVVRAVTLPRLGDHGKGDHNPQIIALRTAYQRLRIASSPFLAGLENVENHLRGEEAYAVQAIKILLSTQITLPQHQWSMIEKWASGLQVKPLLLAEWQTVLQPLLAEVLQTWYRFLNACSDDNNAVDVVAKETFFRQCTQLLAWWQPNFCGSWVVLQAKETLKKRYHALPHENVNARDLLQRLNLMLDTVACKPLGNPFNDDDWIQIPIYRGNLPRTSSNNPFFDDCQKRETVRCENMLPKTVPQEQVDTITVDDLGNELNKEDDVPLFEPTTSTPTGDVLEKPLCQPELLFGSSSNDGAPHYTPSPHCVNTSTDDSELLKPREVLLTNSKTRVSQSAISDMPPKESKEPLINHRSLPSSLVAQSSSNGSQQSSSKAFNTTPTISSKTAIPPPVTLDPTMQAWIEKIKQGLSMHYIICSHHGKDEIANKLVKLAEQMARDGVVEVANWQKRFTLDLLYQNLLGVLAKPRTPSLLERLLGNDISPYIPEFRFTFNLIARLYQWDKDKSDANKQQELLGYLANFQRLVKTPTLHAVCQALLTELQGVADPSHQLISSR